MATGTVTTTSSNSSTSQAYFSSNGLIYSSDSPILISASGIGSSSTINSNGSTAFIWDSTFGSITINGDIRKRGKSNNKINPEIIFKAYKRGLKILQYAKFKKRMENFLKIASEYELSGARQNAQKLFELAEIECYKSMLYAQGYTKYIEEKTVNKYTDKLPSNKDLVITKLEDFSNPIPNRCMKKVKEAKGKNIFDSFVVFHIEEVKDPIIFGKINIDLLNDKYYFITCWDDDIKFSDLAKYQEESVITSNKF